MAKEYHHKQGHFQSLRQEPSMCDSCLSYDSTIMEDKVCSSTLSPLWKPGLDFMEECDGEEDEKYWRAALWKNSIMLLFMFVSFSAVAAPGALNAFIASCQSGKPFASATQILRGFEGVWRMDRILAWYPSVDLQALQHCGLLLLGTAAILAAIIAAAIYFAYNWQKNRRNDENPVVVETARGKVEAEAELVEDDNGFSQMECRPSSEVWYSPLVQKKNPSEEIPREWNGTSIPEVTHTMDYSPAQMTASDKKVTPIESLIAAGDTIQRPDRRSRRKSMSSVTHDAVREEFPVDSSRYGRFMATENIVVKEAAEEHLVTVALRRSSRIRKQAMSPPSAGRLLISSKG